MFLMYFDDNPKRTTEEKIQGAMAAYKARYGVDARMVLCHPEQLIVHPSVLVVTGESQGIPIRMNNFWMGIN